MNTETKKMLGAQLHANEDDIYFITCDTLPLDQVNRNGRRVSKEVAQALIDELGGRPLPCRIDLPANELPAVAEVDMSKTIGFSNLRIEGNMIKADMAILKNTETIKELCAMMEQGTAVPALYGVGNTFTRDDNIEQVTNYTVCGVGIIDKNRSVL